MIKFYGKERAKAKNPKKDVNITSTNKVRVSINKDISDSYFTGYVIIGYDEKYPNRLFFRNGNDVEGVKLLATSPYRNGLTCAKSFKDIVANFVGEYDAEYFDEDTFYIEKK